MALTPSLPVASQPPATLPVPLPRPFRSPWHSLFFRGLRPPLVVEVFPTGDYSKDADRIQQAVAGPGRNVILLKATEEGTGAPNFFNLGDDNPNPRRTIEVTRNVTIIGEAVQPQIPTRQKPMAMFPVLTLPNGTLVWADRPVLYGGRKCLHCSPQNPASTLNISTLTFEAPQFAAVQVGRSSGVTVSNCFIHAVTSDHTDFKDGGNIVVAFGIEVTGVGAKKAGLSSDLTGYLNITDNRITRSLVDMHLDPGNQDVGISVQNTNMIVDIHGNDVSDFGSAGIALLELENKGCPVQVSGNTVTHCGYRDPDSGGIVVRNTNASVKPIVCGPTNTIHCGQPSGVDPVSSNGISLLGASYVVVTGNTLDGAVAAHGIWVTRKYVKATGTWAKSTNNIITQNNLAGLTGIPQSDYVCIDPLTDDGSHQWQGQGNILP